jgi:aryl-alcohol dehydrogenase-like predicted oxidoreductase
MRYNQLGKTGYEISALSFGASSLGGVFHEIDEGKAIKAVHVALELGINYIDVAPAYGGTKAETVLGKALKGIPRSSFYLSTKVGKNTSSDGYGVDSFDYSSEGIRRSLDASAKRIGVDYFDIVHLHDIEYNNRVNTDWALNEGMKTLFDLKQEGRIGAVGIGMYPVDLWERVLQEGLIDVGLSHNLYCLNDTRLLPLLELAKSKGIGLINASPFASGLLTSRGAPGWHPATRAQRRIFEKAATYCIAHGVEIEKLAIQFSSQHPDLITTMFSSSNPETVRRNVEWSSMPIDEKLLEAVLNILTPVSNQNWNY